MRFSPDAAYSASMTGEMDLEWAAVTAWKVQLSVSGLQDKAGDKTTYTVGWKDVMHACVLLL